MLGFAGIGMASIRQKKENADDYLLAGRDVPAWLAALSAVATNNSGYMFIGQIGLTWTIGLSSMWLAVGWIAGDLLVWTLLYRRLREQSGRLEARSVPTLIAGGTSRAGRWLVIACALLVIAFLGSYAAAQLLAGAKALHAVLGWDLAVGVVIGAALVLLYSYSGGLRASIWTDAAQSFVMLGAMCALLIWALVRLGGFGGLFGSLASIDETLLDPFAGGGDLGFAPWALGWLGAGLGVLGQPTIVVRVMALRSAAEVPRAARTYFAWYIPFYAATILLGLCARVMLPELSDPELAMPRLATELFPEVLVGVLLAGIFAATMSTADSQVLSCSAALTQDLFPQLRERYAANKLATALVTFIALAIALNANEGVFALVLYAWSALAVTLAPLLTLRALDRTVSAPLGIAMMATALGATFAWRAAGLGSSIYEIVPGLAAAFAVYGIGWAMGVAPPPSPLSRVSEA